MRVKEETEKVGLNLNIHKMKIMASSSMSSWQIAGKKGGSSDKELSYIEDAWEDDEEAYGTLFFGTSIKTDDLSKLEAFLDKINEIVEPVIETAEGWDEEAWLYSIESLGIARVGWTKYGFIIVGGMM